MCRGVRVVRSQLSHGRYTVYQNSLIPLGKYDRCNTPPDTTFIIAAGSAGEIGYSQEQFWAADDCYYLIPNDGVASKFLFYSLLGHQSQISGSVRRGSVPRLARDVIGNLELRLPEGAIQHKITDALSAVDTQIVALQQLLSKYESIKKATVNLLLKPSAETTLICIGDGFKLSGGLSATRDDLGDAGYCYLHYGDIHAANQYCFDTEKDYSSIPKLDVNLKNVSTTSLLEDGDVVFVDASEDTEGASKYIAIRNPNSIPYIAGLHTIVAKPNWEFWDKDYLAVIFQSTFVRKQFATLASGTKVCGVNKTTIKNIRIPCPTLKEQHRIAEKLMAIEAIFPPIKEKLEKLAVLKQSMLQYFFG